MEEECWLCGSPVNNSTYFCNDRCREEYKYEELFFEELDRVDEFLSEINFIKSKGIKLRDIRKKRANA